MTTQQRIRWFVFVLTQLTPAGLRAYSWHAAKDWFAYTFALSVVNIWDDQSQAKFFSKWG